MDVMALPHSVASEQALLGVILTDNDNFERVSAQLPADDFFVPLHAALYRIIGGLLNERLEANPITIAHKAPAELGDKPTLIAMMAGLFEASASCTDPASLAYVVSELAYQRRLIGTAAELTKAANAHDVERARELQGRIAELTANFVRVGADNPLAQLRTAFKEACEARGMMKTSVPAWDETFGGIFKGSRYIIAGHGGAGKSALALNIAWNMAKAGLKTRWLSYEESPSALWWRILAREARVPVAAFRNGLSEAQKAIVTKKQEEVLGHDFMGFYGLSDLGQMVGACGACDLIVLDGITSAPAPGASNKIEKAGVVTEYCAAMAQKTGAAVIMLAHVNSDSIKTGASMTGIYGGQAATFDPEGIVDLRWADDSKRITTMNVIKNRYGAAGAKVNIGFDGNFQTYYTVSQ